METTEVDDALGFVVIDLIDEMASKWESSLGAYPGGPPYAHNSFRQFYSDHHPVVVRLRTGEGDDD